MKEEDFASFLWALENTSLAWAADDLRERDTAQRESLVEMKVERDQYRDLYDASIGFADRYKEERDKLLETQVQLAEAVKFLRAIEASKPLFNPNGVVTLESLQAFLARHAEQDK